jgi:2-polyprenyl-3-methyl-5-hydroxy-6-metoxy-1,4-benzoquinol methylase
MREFVTVEYVPCNLCGADNRSPYCRVGEFQIVRCGRCGLFYTNPRVPVSELPKIYSETYFVSDNPSVLGYDDYAGHANGLRQVFGDHLRVIERFVRPPAAILDIGCAYGYFLELAVLRGWKGQGVEISAHAAQVAQAQAKAPVHAGTLADAGFAPASFDVATMWDMLEHSFDPMHELRAANQILKPGGYLFLTLPDAGSLLARLCGRHWFGFKKAAEHNYFFSERTLREMFLRTGFQAVDVRRGVWPCNMWFLTTKLAPYSETLSRVAQRAVRRLGLEKTVVKFRFIDMFVIARKSHAAPQSDGQ